MLIVIIRALLMGDTTTNDYSAMVHTLLFSLDDPNPKVTTLTIEAFALLHHQMGDTRLRPLLLDHSILAAHLSTLTHRFASPVCPLPYVGRDGVLKILDRRGSSINNNNNKDINKNKRSGAPTLQRSQTISSRIHTSHTQRTTHTHTDTQTQRIRPRPHSSLQRRRDHNNIINGYQSGVYSTHNNTHTIATDTLTDMRPTRTHSRTHERARSNSMVNLTSSPYQKHRRSLSSDASSSPVPFTLPPTHTHTHTHAHTHTHTQPQVAYAHTTHHSPSTSTNTSSSGTQVCVCVLCVCVCVYV